jgi:RNA polymerase sigma factor (sigma-70 family)
LKKVRLSVSEEVGLLPAAKLACRGDKNTENVYALELLLGSVKDLVWKFAIQNTKRCPDFVDDAYAEGMNKVLLIIPSFQPGKSRFTTFAGFCANRHIQLIVRREIKYRKRFVTCSAPDSCMFTYNEEQNSDAHKYLDFSKAIKNIPVSDKPYADLYFGFKTGKPQTLQAVANVFGITRERVRQRIKRAILKIREKELA